MPDDPDAPGYIFVRSRIEWLRHVVQVMPKWFPVNFFDFVGYARGHIAPVLIATNCGPAVRAPNLPDLNGLLMGSGFEELNERSYPSRIGLSLPLIKSLSLRRLEHFLLERLEPNGTLLSYASATFFMVYALIGMGYPKNHPVIVKAIEGLKSLIYPLPSGSHIQNMTSTVWNTDLIGYAVHATGRLTLQPLGQ